MRDDMAAQAVLSRLGRGSDAARSLADLAEELNWPRRMVEQSIQDLRLDGQPIASGPHGVWLGDMADLDATLRSLRSRMVNQYRTYLAMRRTLRAKRAGEVHQETIWSDAA